MSRFVFWAFLVFGCKVVQSAPSLLETADRFFSVTGIVQEISPDLKSVVVKHEAVPNYMPAMTMPFELRQTNLAMGFHTNDKITFRLNVAAQDSWIDQINVVSNVPAVASAPSLSPEDRDTLITFTNEFGQAVKMTDFKGQALALTFFFTRCPVPNACPRLSQNFADASQTLLSMPNAPTNWHFVSISFDPEFDTPEVMRAYAKRYRYDSNHWTFLTGPKERVDHLTKKFGVEYKPGPGIYSHSFRTVIITPKQKVQMMYPISGDLGGAIVKDMLKALGVTNSAGGL